MSRLANEKKAPRKTEKMITPLIWLRLPRSVYISVSSQVG